MKDLGREIVDELLGNKIALVPGGYKPPTAGHFYLVEQAAKQPGVKEVVVLIGHKERDGLTKDQSFEIWNIYKKYLPENVRIEVSKEKAPVLDMFHLLKENENQNYLALIGVRNQKDEKDLRRFKTLKERFGDRVEVVVVNGTEGISGTNAREAILNNDFTGFHRFLPIEISDIDKDTIWNILQESYKGKRTDDGAPGTFKAKITKAYGGPVTIAKAKKFKNRQGATAHDKRQANWFINFHSAKNENQIIEDDDPCWDNYEMVGTKEKNGKEVPNCVPKENLQEATIVAPPKPAAPQAAPKAPAAKPKKPSATVYEYTVNELMEKFPTIKAACEGAWEKATHTTTGEESKSQRYATFLSNQQNAKKELKKLPNIKIVDGTVTNGLDRIEAIYILQNTSGVPRDGEPTEDQEGWIKFKLKCEVEGENPEAEPELAEAGTEEQVETTATNSNQIVEDLKPLIEELTKFMKDNGKKVFPAPKVNFVDNQENAKDVLGKTGYYDPDTKCITLYVTNRHPKDILRTYAHELIHHQQNLEDRLGNVTTQNVNEDDHLKKLEEEAYLESQIMLRSWENGRGQKSLNEVIEHDKSKGTWTVKSEKGDRSFGTYKTEKEAKKRLRQIEFFKHKAKNEQQELLQEGAYDLLTRRITKDILKSWKEEYAALGEVPEGPQLLQYEELYEEEDAKGRRIDFEVEANLQLLQTDDREYVVDGGANPESDVPYLQVSFLVDPRELPQKWSEIYMDLMDVVRHEIEHMTQFGGNVRPGKEIDAEIDRVYRNLIDMGMLPTGDYYKLPMELDAQLQGMYLKAKKAKLPFNKVLTDYLGSYIDKEIITAEEAEDILALWRTRLKALNLPNF